MYVSEFQKARESVIQSCLIRGVRKERDLHQFIEYTTGKRVPFKKICAHHDTPWDYVSGVFFDKHPSYVIIAPRDGGKTWNTGTLNFCELALKSRFPFEIGAVGAIREQAKKCFKYTHDGFDSSVLTMNLLKRDTTTEIETIHGGTFWQAASTLNQSNSPHPCRLRLDEVELIPWNLLEEMFFAPHSVTNNEGDVIMPSSLVLISSRKFANGNMYKLEEDAGKLGFHLLKWCYKEVSAPCPVERRGANRVHTVVKDMLTHAEEEIEVYEGCPTCPLVHTCRGDLGKAEGFIPVEDSLKTFGQVSADAWLNQKEARAAGASLLCYAFRQSQHLGGDYNPNLSTEVWADPGGRVPASVLWFQWQRRPGDKLDHVYIIDEVYTQGKPSRWIFERIREKNAHYRCQPQWYYVDPANTQFITDMQDDGFTNIRGAYKGDIVQGIERVKAYMESADGTVYLHVNPRCVSTINEFFLYQWPSLTAALPKARHNHSMDLIRYFITNHFGMQPREDGEAAIPHVLNPVTHMRPGSHPANVTIPRAAQYRGLPTPANAHEYAEWRRAASALERKR